MQNTAFLNKYTKEVSFQDMDENKEHKINSRF